MGVALTTADAVIIGRVERTSSKGGMQLLVVQVVKSLKDQLDGEIEIALPMMCYQSFSFEDFKAGERYIFPLIVPDLSNPWVVSSLSMEADFNVAKSSGRLFTLPTCSHTALALVGEKLYSNELTPDGGSRLEYYMSLRLMEFLFWAGLLDLQRLAITIAVVLALVISVVIWKRRLRGGGHA